MKPDAVRKRLQRAGERLVAASQDAASVVADPITEEESRHVAIDNVV
jgi:hypothetical protein